MLLITKTDLGYEWTYGCIESEDYFETLEECNLDLIKWLCSEIEITVNKDLNEE